MPLNRGPKLAFTVIQRWRMPSKVAAPPRSESEFALSGGRRRRFKPSPQRWRPACGWHRYGGRVRTASALGVDAAAAAAERAAGAAVADGLAAAAVVAGAGWRQVRGRRRRRRFCGKRGGSGGRLPFDGAGHVVDTAFKKCDTAGQPVALDGECAHLRRQKLHVGLELGHARRHLRNSGGLIQCKDLAQAFARGFGLACDSQSDQSDCRGATPSTQPQKRFELARLPLRAARANRVPAASVQSPLYGASMGRIIEKR